MRRLVCVFACLILVSSLTQVGIGQTGAEVTGTVFYKSNLPAVNCSVTLGGKVATVDVKGRFRLENIPPGEYELQIWCLGRLVKSQRVSIRGSASDIPSIVI